MNRTNAIKAYQEALQYMPGGVNSPVRALQSVGETPLFIKKAHKATLTDVDNNRFIDFCMSWGVFILGHAHSTVNESVKKAVIHGSSYGIPSLQETTLAKLVNRYFPSMEKLRFVSSGTEAVMSAIRLARAYTGRNVIVKFDGCYHGHADHLLVTAGSGAAQSAASSSAGVPDSFTSLTVSLPFNDTEAIDALFRNRGTEIAAVIVEPVPANMGVIIPQPGFLQHLRMVTEKYQSVLIFDEVITGFRLSIGGAQQYFGISADMTILGKIIGGGFPSAAFGGKREIMSLLAPEGNVYQAGTLAGNPVAMSAGIATIEVLSKDRFYENLEKISRSFFYKLSDIAFYQGMTVNHIGSMFTIFCAPTKINHYEDAKGTDHQRFGKLFRYMLDNGIYLSPSPFEASFLSEAHNEDHLRIFLYALRKFKS
jgi:glutamate-1-semialdehyde 2,1-aminomutase